LPRPQYDGLAYRFVIYGDLRALVLNVMLVKDLRPTTNNRGAALTRIRGAQYLGQGRVDGV
jgi:hypothetical protein